MVQQHHICPRVSPIIELARREYISLVSNSRTLQQRRRPRPCAHNSRSDESRFHAPGRRVEFLRRLGREARVPVLEVGNAHHDKGEEEAHADDDAVACALRQDSRCGDAHGR